MPTFEDCKELFYKFNKELLLKQLHEGFVDVKFTKVDGNVRAMTCTLNPFLIPQSNTTLAASNSTIQVKSSKTPNPNVCVVFDTQKHAWRSFRYDSVISTSLDWPTKV